MQRDDAARARSDRRLVRARAPCRSPNGAAARSTATRPSASSGRLRGRSDPTGSFYSLVGGGYADRACRSSCDTVLYLASWSAEPEVGEKQRRTWCSPTTCSIARHRRLLGAVVSPTVEPIHHGDSGSSWSTRWCASCLLTLWNTCSFFTVYANIDRFDPTGRAGGRCSTAGRRLAQLVARVGDGLEVRRHELGTPSKEFVDELSMVLHRGRRRFWKSESDRDKLTTSTTLYESSITLPLWPTLGSLPRSSTRSPVRSVKRSARPRASALRPPSTRPCRHGDSRRVGAGQHATRPPSRPAALAPRWWWHRGTERAALGAWPTWRRAEAFKECAWSTTPTLLDYALKPNLGLRPRLAAGAVGGALREVDAPDFVGPALREARGSAPRTRRTGEAGALGRRGRDYSVPRSIAPRGCRSKAFRRLGRGVRPGAPRQGRRARAGIARSPRLLAQKRRLRIECDSLALAVRPSSSVPSNATQASSGARPMASELDSATGPDRTAIAGRGR